jgi:ABC-2 type transport system permease protein
MQMGFFFFLPSLLLSVFMFPFRSMPAWAQALGELLPLTHFLRVVRYSVEGLNPAKVVPHVWPLVLFIVVVLAIGLKRFRQTLD